MKIRTIIVLCLTAALSDAGSLAQKTESPRFADYPVAVWGRKVAALDMRSHPLARKFRTTIRQQMREEGVNFAGHYTLASAGCGTGCSISSFIDARTGRAYFPNELNGWTGIVGDYEIPEGEDSWTYKPESRLLKVIGRPRIGNLSEERYGPSGIYYYEWKNNRLRLVKFIPVGSYPNADPAGASERSAASVHFMTGDSL